MKMFSDVKSKLIKKIDNELFKVYFKGIFIYNNFIDEEAVYSFLDSFSNNSFNFEGTKGNYIIQILDKETGKKFCFTDNSGIYRIYFFKNNISESFLDLVGQISTSEVQLNLNSIVEFLHFGHIYFNKTFVKELQILDKNDFLIIDITDELLIDKKNIPQIEDKPDINFKKSFSDIIRLLKDKNISIDLTGGIDSRLIVSFFNKVIPNFELAISGLPENSDIKIANKIANLIQKPFNPTFHTSIDISKDDLLRIFQNTDGQVDVISYHRNNQLNDDRFNRNIELQISGVGGELFKDFWWLQDFPLYKKKKSNIEKLYNFRIEGTTFPHHILSKELENISLNLKNNTINNLSTFQQSTNTRTYDKIYYEYKMRGNASSYLLSASKYFNVYAPLLELDLVRIGYNLERSSRFFNNFHRMLITSLNKKLAKIKSTEDISSSSLFWYKMADIFGYIKNKSKRITKVLIRKTFKQSVLQESPDNPRVYLDVKKNEFVLEFEQLLKENKIMSEQTSLTSVSKGYFGRFITIGFFIYHIQKD